jgi:hypothetical protein
MLTLQHGESHSSITDHCVFVFEIIDLLSVVDLSFEEHRVVNRQRLGGLHVYIGPGREGKRVASNGVRGW